MSNIMRFLPLTFIILPYYKHEERKDYENFELWCWDAEHRISADFMQTDPRGNQISTRAPL